MALEMYDFITKSQLHHLTIEDIVKMSPGDKIDVIIWDANWEEYWIWDNAEPGKNYDPQSFFKENRHQITYLGNMEWNIHFNFGDTFRHPVHIITSISDKNWWWSEIVNGSVHTENQGLTCPHGKSLTQKNPKRSEWTQLPHTTRVGWRGPMMLWNKLVEMPQVYYNENADEDNEGDEDIKIVEMPQVYYDENADEDNEGDEDIKIVEMPQVYYDENADEDNEGDEDIKIEHEYCEDCEK